MSHPRASIDPRASSTLLLLALRFLAPPQVQADEPSVDLGAVRAPELLGRLAGGLVPLPVAAIDVDIEVTGILAHGRVRQRFSNPSADTIEVIYAFPLSDRGAIHRMELRVGERRIVAEIEERERARTRYEDAQATGRKAALLSERRPNLFTLAAANIDPGETIEVELEYHEQLAYRDGRLELRFPLVFLPRYSPSSAVEASLPPTDAAARPLAEMLVGLLPGFPLGQVDSESHALDVQRTDGAVVVTPRDGPIVGDRDFVVSWTAQRGKMPTATAIVEEREGLRYALLTVLPPEDATAGATGLPTETVFVVDVSGSMAGPSHRQAQAALLQALDRLRPSDRFAIVAFSNVTTTFRPALEPAAADTIDAARLWVRALEANGGTEIYPALMRALEILDESRARHGRRILFLTDGAVSNEAELLTGLVERIGDVRLHAIGIGPAPNAWLMRKMAQHGHGLCEFVSSEKSVNRIAEVFERLERPVLEDVRADLSVAGHAATYPEQVPDLHAGEPLVVWSRIDSSAPLAWVVQGYAASGPWTVTVDQPVTAAPESGIAIGWARARVDAVLDTLHEGADAEAVRREVVDLGLDFGLVTPYTSLVAVEATATALGPSRTVRMSALPAGGTNHPLQRRLGALLLAAGLALVLLARKPAA